VRSGESTGNLCAHPVQETLVEMSFRAVDNSGDGDDDASVEDLPIESGDHDDDESEDGSRLKEKECSVKSL
jgi:hypothetical protein